MKRSVLYFTAPHQVSLCEEELPEPEPGQVLVKTVLSAISPGTEALIYRGQFPRDLEIDAKLPALSGKFTYPFSYGYAAVGQVIRCGEDVDPAWEGQKVFAFQPHASHFLAAVDSLLPIPEQLALEDAVFLPNMETAVNFLLDGAPVIGERVVVFGQGIVGLLTTALLALFPLQCLVTLEPVEMRRQASLQAGAHHSFDPLAPQVLEQVKEILGTDLADLVYELSGTPDVLNQALALCGFAGRLVIGSWYGEKRASLDLGGRFHRSRIHPISSQVSTLSPERSGRWTHTRRFEVAWEMLAAVRPSRWITHRFPYREAQEAYHTLDTSPGETIQILLTYT